MKQFTVATRPELIADRDQVFAATANKEISLVDALEWVYDGDERNNRVITYCGGGVAASSVAFTMHRLGFTDVAVYMGSLQEWAADPAKPMSLN